MKIIEKCLLVLLTTSLITSLTSCATIMHGSRQSIGIASNPTDASVWVDQCYTGNTPLIVEMTRQDNHHVRLELEGYQPYEINFSRQISGWVFGNVVFGGVIGLAVDAVSGGIYRLTPEQVQVELRANRMTVTKKSNESYIAIVLEPDASWTRIGNLVPVEHL